MSENIGRVISRVDLTGVTYTEAERPRGGRQWLYVLSKPIPYTRDEAVGYESGELLTDRVIVSWGSAGDTLIAPAHEKVPGSGEWFIADMFGFWWADWWVHEAEAMADWFAQSGVAGVFGEVETAGVSS